MKFKKVKNRFNLKSKAIWIFGIFIFMLFFSNDFGLINIEKTAIISAIAIDKNGDDYEIATQIALPEKSESSGGNNEVVIKGKGKTVAEALTDIELKTGWYPKLVFCNIILLSEGVASFGVMPALDFFIRSDNINDSVLLAVAEDSAVEMLSLASPLENLTAMALTKIILNEGSQMDEVIMISLKDFTNRYYSKSQCSLLPLVKKVESSSKKNSGASAQGDNSSKSYIFDASSSAVFNLDKKIGVIEKKETKCYNLFFNHVKMSDLNFAGLEGENITLGILKTTTKKNITIANNIPKMKISINLKCNFQDKTKVTKVENLTFAEKIPDDIRKEGEKYLALGIDTLFYYSKLWNTDILRLKERLYSYNYKDYEKYSNDIIKTIIPSISVIIKDDNN